MKEYEINYNVKDVVISDTIVFHIFFMACKNMLVSNSSWLFSHNDFLNSFSAILIFFIYIKMLWKLHGNITINKSTTLIIIALLLFCAATAVIDPIRFTSTAFPYIYVRIQAKTFFIYCFPLFFCVTLLDSLDYLINAIFEKAYILFLGASIAFGFKLIDNMGMYSMSYGYNAIWCFLVYCFKFKKEKNIKLLIPAVFTGFYILVAGSRGPLLCIFASITLLFLGMKKTLKSVMIMFFSLFLMAMCYVFFDEILDFLINFLDSINVSSRTLLVLRSGDIDYSKDRDHYHNDLFMALNKSPVLGLGAFGGEATVGLAHSLYLDIFANFGYLFGGLYLLYIFINVFTIYFSDNNSSTALFIAILACICLPIGFVESEFWISKELWMIMGAIIVYKKNVSKSINKSISDTLTI